ncbi:hypothetical protein AMTR_s00099p00131860 [Amborella trichopoda]|uniref:Uncharacterized protein n=2 Tax=Amborella trichopoda TaxID=13333 RepID=W1NYK5_AMBTC|nr:hypothetical protein AMTR_s00099p00131860 [Amborella trichopoda]
MEEAEAPRSLSEDMEASVVEEEINEGINDESANEESINEDEVNDEDVEEEEDECFALFEGDMDPLGFADANESVIETFEKFERLEYEALAERKRKGITDSSGESSKRPRQENLFGANIEEIEEVMRYGSGRKSSEPKKRGRKKGSKKKLSPEVTRKIMDANIHYTFGRYDEAVSLLTEIVRLAPSVADSYITLGIIYNDRGDKKRAKNFYSLAAYLTPKNPKLWECLITLSKELGDMVQVNYCFSRAIKANPEDLSLAFLLASHYSELGDYPKAAESYDRILKLCPGNVEACKLAAEMYHSCGQVERAISILENFIKEHPEDADLTVVRSVAALNMENKDYLKALKHIEAAKVVYCSGKVLPCDLIVKAGICEAYLGHMEKAEEHFGILQKERVKDLSELTLEVAESLANIGHHDIALNYFMMLEGTAGCGNESFFLKVAQSYSALKDTENAIQFFYKAINASNNNIDARLTLTSLLLEKNKEDEALKLLSPPEIMDSNNTHDSVKSEPWWLSGKIKKQLAYMYHRKGMLVEFLNTIFPLIEETLSIEVNKIKKVRPRRKLTQKDLLKRIEVLKDCDGDNLIRGARLPIPQKEVIKANRAKKLLPKRAMEEEEAKAAALAAGMMWKSDDSDIEPLETTKEPPLPGLLKDEEHYQLLLNVCKALSSLQRDWDAFTTISSTLNLVDSTFPNEKKEELQSLRAKVAYNTSDPNYGCICAKEIVRRRPHSIAAWNWFYKVLSRFMEHRKEILLLHAQKVQSPFVNSDSIKRHSEIDIATSCTSSISTVSMLGMELWSHMLFLNVSMLTEQRLLQESNYNIGRAFQHVGLVTLAVSYYEKVLEVYEKDYPSPKHPDGNFNRSENPKEGYSNLHKEAAHNLHLIYKRSGALDLARQVEQLDAFQQDLASAIRESAMPRDP